MRIILEKAINKIKKLKGVVDVKEMDYGDRNALNESELNRNGDIIPVLNTGLEDCLKREYLLLLLKNHNFRCASEPTVLLITAKGRILGQEVISDEEKENFRCREDIYFLSNDFVLFKNDRNTLRTGGEKQLFILPSIPFPELDNIENIEDIVSCSPSTAGDSYLRNKYGYPDDRNLATILIGFSEVK